MSGEDSHSESVRIWVDYEAAMTLAGCTKRFHRNKTFISNLESIFAHLCKKFELLCNYQRSLHFFLNSSLTIEFSHKEAHVLEASPSVAEDVEASYNRLMLTAADNEVLVRYMQRESGGQTAPHIIDLTSDDLNKLLEIFNIKPHGSEMSTGILIPFNYGSINMGSFILWKQDSPKFEPRRSNDEALRGWVSTYYTFLKSFFKREYQIFPQTYLPSHYSARWAKAAILFADIRNFTPLTEVLRNVYAKPGAQDTSVFREIMDEHCKEMANIIQNGRGRIDKFLGDGIMAIFGEHDPHPSKTVCRAVAAAVRMVERFTILRSGFLRKAFGGGYETEYNESVEVELGVGINYGTVLFEYLGDDQHREYTAVGDHVNFAQRLESQAARLDEHTNVRAPPILLSQTAERCVRPWINPNGIEQVVISPKGKSQLYKVHGIRPESFHWGLYDQSEKFDDWDTPWRSTKDKPPEV